MRIYTVESLRIPEEGSSTQGKSGPKVRPKGVADGQQVEIPVLPSHVVNKQGRRRRSCARRRKSAYRKVERNLSSEAA